MNDAMVTLVHGGTAYVKVSEDEPETSERPAFSPGGARTFRTYRETSAEELESRDLLAPLIAKAQRARSHKST